MTPDAQTALRKKQMPAKRGRRKMGGGEPKDGEDKAPSARRGRKTNKEGDKKGTGGERKEKEERKEKGERKQRVKRKNSIKMKKDQEERKETEEDEKPRRKRTPRAKSKDHNTNDSKGEHEKPRKQENPRSQLRVKTKTMAVKQKKDNPRMHAWKCPSQWSASASGAEFQWM